ncbi:anaerobic ribonucleoside-triphosphate reductase activating protein [bacterium D16-50]|nr:anaerobic ribonucleoside-triphosphate reductase activating protein [Lachnospiraceae bacterium]RKJ20402.1 anaerobic ribonucleoside-triphosphate reductase activating protein [bacterium D16-50]
MNYANIKRTDVANGPGIRVSLFVSGCTHGCRGCFNKEAWDFHYGEEYTALVEEEILRLLAPDYIRGLSVLGGEPMEPQNREAVLGLLRKVRQRYPQKDIWCYTGYDYEKDILSWAQQQEAVRELLSLIDVLVDGEFVEERKNLRLAFRGSENQRLIDVKESGRQKKTVCLSI